MRMVSLEMVPTNWLVNADWSAKTAKCHWPTFAQNKKAFKAAVGRLFEPDEDWELHDLSLIAKASMLDIIIFINLFI